MAASGEDGASVRTAIATGGLRRLPSHRDQAIVNRSSISGTGVDNNVPTKRRASTLEIRRDKLRDFANNVRAHRSSQLVDIGAEGLTEPSVVEDDKHLSDGAILKELFLSKINVLLIFAPLGILCEKLEISKAGTFSLCFVGLMPLAKLLGDATEHLADNLNQTIGGLLNATFGNAVEMIITISAIQQGKLEIVKNSLLGSILSNLLLVLGMSFFAGGLARSEQHFSGSAALINVTMLFVGIMSFSLATIFSWSAPEANILTISRVSAIFVFIGYAAYLFFQLHTHAALFEDDAPQEEAFSGTSVEYEDDLGDRITFQKSDSGGVDYLVNGKVIVTDVYTAHLEGHRLMLEGTPVTAGDSRTRTSVLSAGQELKGHQAVALVNQLDSPEDDHEATLSVPAAMGLLLVSTVVVAYLSEYMVEAIDGLVSEWGVPEAFVGVILLPIVGNACEHVSAVRMAYINKTATAIAIAVGSSTQIALFVMPFSVIAGWCLEKKLDFNLHATGLAILFMSVLVVFSIVMDGKSNWLSGFMLMLCYCIVSILYWYSPHMDSKRG